jgi:type I restriction enzyme S subunit
MSNIPKLRFKEFKEPWKENKLQNIGSISMCKRVLKKDTNEIGDIPFYKIGTFGKKADAYISNDYFKTLKEKYKYPKKGDILLSAAGTIGRTVEFDGLEAYFQDSNIVWLNNNEKIIQNKFLHLLYNNLNWVSQDTTIKRLVNSTINSTVINYPKDIKEQEKIATFINSVDTYINQLDEKENLMEEYIKGVNQQIFSQKIRFKKEDGSSYEDWEVIGLETLYKSQMGKTILKKDLISKGIPIYSATEDYKIFGYVAKSKLILDKGDLITSARGTIGSVKYLNKVTTGTQTTICSIKNKDNNNNLSYIVYQSLVLNRKTVFKIGKGGIPQLTIKEFNSIQLFLPTNIEEQEKIANFLQSLNQELLNIREEKELTKEFKKGLLQQMFV